MDFTGLDALDDPVMDHLSGITAPDALDNADGFPGALRRHRIVPAMLLVEDVAQRVVVRLVARRRDIEAAAADKLHARGDEMQLDAVFVRVAHPENIALVGVETGEGQTLEIVHHLPLLAVVRRVLGREGDDTGTIGPLVRASVD